MLWRPLIPAFLIALILSSNAFSQQPEKQETGGTVTGRVFCNDTNAPARMAWVTPEPVPNPSDVEQANPSHQTAAANAPRAMASVTSVETGLDGSFTIKHVKPGVYYVIAEMPGYFFPLASLSQEEWNHPTASVTDRLAKMLQRVSVDANHTPNVTIGLDRGAAVSGTITFNDGSPAIGIHIKALRQKDDGTWSSVQLSAVQRMIDLGTTTNDLGQYRIAGLSAGTYVIEADLSLSRITVTRDMGSSRGMEENAQYSLTFFSGGKLKADKDAAFELTAGESRPGEDILIPKLHSVSGTLVAARDGRPLVGSIRLLNVDGETTLANVQAESPSGEFHFTFVPEGHFVFEAWAVDPQVLADAAKNREPQRNYGTLKEPLDINSDIDGLVMSVPPFDEKATQ